MQATENNPRDEISAAENQSIEAPEPLAVSVAGFIGVISCTKVESTGVFAEKERIST